MFQGLLYADQGQNVALTVLYVPHSLDSRAVAWQCGKCSGRSSQSHPSSRTTHRTRNTRTLKPRQESALDGVHMTVDLNNFGVPVSSSNSQRYPYKKFHTAHFGFGSIGYSVRGTMHIQSLVDSGSVGSTLGGVSREQKMLKGHLPRVIYHQVY
jgi:hypothetical protein